MGNARISHLFVFVNDVNAELAFYRDVLGFVVFHHDEDSAFLRLPSDPTVLALHKRHKRTTVANGRNWMLVIDVDDVHRHQRDLSQTGVNIGPVEPVPYGMAAQLSDPEGNSIELHQPGGS